MHKEAEPGSLTSLREKLIKIGANVVSHGGYVTMGCRLVAHKTCCFAFVMAHLCRRCLSQSIPAPLMLVRAAPEAGAISIRISLKPGHGDLGHLASGTRFRCLRHPSRLGLFAMEAQKPDNRARLSSKSEEKPFPKCELPHTSRPFPGRFCLRVGG
jgi:hypothetical protein